jgi:hypothetical protein
MFFLLIPRMLRATWKCWIFEFLGKIGKKYWIFFFVSYPRGCTINTKQYLKYLISDIKKSSSTAFDCYLRIYSTVYTIQNMLRILRREWYFPFKLSTKESFLLLSLLYNICRVDSALTEILRIQDIFTVRNIPCESNDDIRIRLYYSLLQITK